MDPYVYPGTNVLRNLRDFRTLRELSELEAEASSWRLSQLERRPLRGKFDIAHLQAIHRYIFQDVYPWAGELRTVDIARPGQFYFAFSQQIRPCLLRTFADLQAERHLKGAAAQEFCHRAAHYMGELNAIHPFRDGNGRTQREFIRQLALHGGHVLNWGHVTRAQMYAASHLSFQAANNSGLEKVLMAAVGLPELLSPSCYD